MLDDKILKILTLLILNFGFSFILFDTFIGSFIFLCGSFDVTFLVIIFQLKINFKEKERNKKDVQTQTPHNTTFDPQKLKEIGDLLGITNIELNQNKFLDSFKEEIKKLKKGSENQEKKKIFQKIIQKSHLKQLVNENFKKDEYKFKPKDKTRSIISFEDSNLLDLLIVLCDYFRESKSVEWMNVIEKFNKKIKDESNEFMSFTIDLEHYIYEIVKSAFDEIIKDDIDCKNTSTKNFLQEARKFFKYILKHKEIKKKDQFIHHLGLIYYILKKYQNAFYCFHKIIKSEDDKISSYTFLLLGIICFQIKEKFMAIHWFKKASEKTKLDTSKYAFKNLIDIYKRRRRIDQVLIYEKNLEDLIGLNFSLNQNGIEHFEDEIRKYFENDKDIFKKIYLLENQSINSSVSLNEDPLDSNLLNFINSCCQSLSINSFDNKKIINTNIIKDFKILSDKLKFENDTDLKILVIDFKNDCESKLENFKYLNINDDKHVILINIKEGNFQNLKKDNFYHYRFYKDPNLSEKRVNLCKILYEILIKEIKII